MENEANFDENGNRLANPITNEETVITVGDTVTLNAKIAELEANLRTAQHKIEQQENWLDKHRKRNEQLCEAILPILEHKIHFIVDNAVHDQISDIDITENISS